MRLRHCICSGHDGSILARLEHVKGVNLIKETCLADKGKHKIRIIHEPEDDNKAHTALRGWPRDNDDLLNLLADEAWSSFVLNKNI